MKIFNIIVLIVLSFLFVPLESSFAQDTDKLRVAAILPLSGEAASWGQAFKNGMLLGNESLSEKIQSQIDIIYEDDALSAKNTISIFNKLAGSGTVDAVINLSSGTAKALAPIIENKKVPLLALALDSAISKGRKYAFNYWVTPEEEVRVLLPEMKKRNYKRIARINTLQEGVLAIKDVFDRQAKGHIEVVLDDDFPPESKDFKTYITKLRAKEKQIDAVMVVLMPGQLNIFARQLRQMGSKLEMFGFETVEDTNEVALSGGTLIGTWYVNADDGNGSFLKTYQERFPGASSYLAASGYDAVRMLGKAVELGVEKEKLNEFFANLKDFSGALGTFSATGDQRFTLPATLKIVTKDGFKKLY